MDAFDAEIRKAYRHRPPPASACVDVEILEALYKNSLPRDRMGEIRSHLASCANCLELARDYCVFRGISPVSEQRSSWFSPVMMRVAAAVLLLAGIGAIWTGVGRMRSAQDEFSGVRGADRPTGGLIAPKGKLQQPPQRLEWNADNSAAYYEVEIQDVRFNPVWTESNITETHVSIPVRVLSGMKDGPYAWRVTTVTRDGKRTTSAFATFEIAR